MPRKKEKQQMNKERKRNNFYLMISGIIFVLFTFVLFINNLTDLLNKYSQNYSLSLITWSGIVFSMVWAMWLIINRRSIF